VIVAPRGRAFQAVSRGGRYATYIAFGQPAVVRRGHRRKSVLNRRGCRSRPGLASRGARRHRLGGSIATRRDAAAFMGDWPCSEPGHAVFDAGACSHPGIGTDREGRHARGSEHTGRCPGCPNRTGNAGVDSAAACLDGAAIGSAACNSRSRGDHATGQLCRSYCTGNTRAEPDPARPGNAPGLGTIDPGGARSSGSTGSVSPRDSGGACGPVIRRKRTGHKRRALSAAAGASSAAISFDGPRAAADPDDSCCSTAGRFGGFAGRYDR
jgi:hypothetical protein